MKKVPIILTFNRSELPKRLAEAWRSAKAAPPVAAENEILIYDFIGFDPWAGEGISAEQVMNQLKAMPTGDATVRINSPGGSIFEGLAIYNALINSGRRINVKIDSLAASIASVIAMAGDEISMAGNAQMMIHKGCSIAIGNADDFRKEAEILDSIDSGSLVATYVARTGQTAEAITQMMTDETWLNAEAAKEKGFTDVIEPLKAAPTKDKKEADDKAAKAQAAHMKTLRQKAQLLHMQAAFAAA